MEVKDLSSLKQAFKEIKNPLFGAGAYAFDRLGLEEITSNYRLLALRYSLDTALIEKDVPTLSLEKGMGTKHIQAPRNATTILDHPKTKKYLNQFDRPAITVYKSSEKMEKVCQENNWLLMSNPTNFGKKLFEDKVNFRKIAQELKLNLPPGKIDTPRRLHYGHLVNKYGLPFVIQHPAKGGGKGTFFIKNKEDFQKAIAKLEEKWNKEEAKIIRPPTEAIVAQFIHGPSPSITGCVTRQGILSTNPQLQILDIPQLYNPEKGSGLFCGHDWTSSSFSEKILHQAYEMVEKIGLYFHQRGYQGIFGLDFILDQKTEKLFLIECNPRLLGSFPALTMCQTINNEPPLIGFHALEFLNHPYRINCQEINRLIRQAKRGSQLFPHNLTGHWARNHKQTKAGIYRLKQGKLSYLRPGYHLKHLEKEEEFLISDGVPFKKSHFSPNRRLCRILSLNRTLAQDNYQSLNEWAKSVAEAVYQSFDLRPIRLLKLKKIFFPHFIAKG